MSRRFLTELEHNDYDIGGVSVNPNYQEDVYNLLKNSGIVISPHEVNVLTPNKKPAATNKNNMKQALPFYSKLYGDEFTKDMLEIINSPDNQKKEYLKNLRENMINFKKINKYFKKN